MIFSRSLRDKMAIGRENSKAALVECFPIFQGYGKGVYYLVVTMVHIQPPFCCTISSAQVLSMKHYDNSNF